MIIQICLQFVLTMFLLCSILDMSEIVMKNKISFLSLVKSLIADIVNLIIIGMSLFLYGLVTFCF